MAVYYKFQYPQGTDAPEVLRKLEEELYGWEKKPIMHDSFCYFVKKDILNEVYCSLQYAENPFRGIPDALLKKGVVVPESLVTEINEDEFLNAIPLNRHDVFTWGSEKRYDDLLSEKKRRIKLNEARNSKKAGGNPG